MNFQSSPVFLPLRVIIINPLTEAAQMTITKIMSGLVFGVDQLVDLILLVYSNERQAAVDLKLELHSCAFPCMNTIEVNTDLPLIEDADVFCFITNFRNPNSVDFTEIDNSQFDVLYLIIKIANSLAKKRPVVVVEEEKFYKKKVFVEEKKPRKPIIMADGVVTLNILRYLTRDSLPSDILFCPTPLPGIAKSILGETLKVKAKVINKILVWAANDEVFHVEVDKPIVVDDKVEIQSKCDWEMVGKNLIQDAGLDFTQFNKTWLKKDFIRKVQRRISKNPYGSIFRASNFARTLALIWKTRAGTATEGMTVYASAGVISDGSLETIKGFAYVLPLIFTGDTWSVDTSFNESFHLQQEIKRINQTVKKLKEKLFPYCKRFLEDNVKNQLFIPAASDTSLTAVSQRTMVSTRSRHY